MELQKHFPRRYGNDGREWVVNDSYSKFCAELSEYIVNEECEKYDFFPDDLYIKHWLYCCASSPMLSTISDREELHSALGSARAGDIFEIWVLSETPKYWMFKCPDENGLAPLKGAY